MTHFNKKIISSNKITKLKLVKNELAINYTVTFNFKNN